MATFDELIAQGYTVDTAATPIPTATPAPSFDDLIAQGYTVQEEPSFWSLDYGSPDQTTVGDSIMSLGGGYLKGVGKGVTFPLELGALAGNKILGALTGYEPIPYPSTAIDSAVDWYTGYEPQTTAARSMQTIADFGGSAVGGGMLGKQLMAAAPQMASPLAQKIVAKTGDILGSNMSAQIGGSLAAGGGAAVAQEMYPDSLAAQIGIPLAAGTGYGMLAAKVPAYLKAVQMFDPQYIDDVARKQALSQLEDYTDVAALPKKVEAARGSLAADPYAPYKSTSEIVADPGLAKLEDVRRLSQKEISAEMYNRDLGRATARTNAAKTLVPDSFNALDEAQTVRAGLENRYKMVKETVKDLADEAFKGLEEIETPRVKAALTSQINNLTKSGATQLSGDFTQLVDNFKTLPKKVDLKTLQEYSSAFGEYASTTPMSSKLDRQTAKVAVTARKVIEKMIDDAVEKGSLPATQKEAYQTMKAMRKEQGRLFERGATGKIITQDNFKTGYKLPEEKVFKEALKTRESTAQLKQALGRNFSTARVAAIDELVNKSTSPTTEQLMPNAYVKGLKNLESKGILTPSQSQALKQIEVDFKSQAAQNVRKTSGSQRTSPTAERMTPLKAVWKIATGSMSDASFKALSKKIPGLALVTEHIDAVRNIPGKADELLNKAILSVDDLDALLKPGTYTPKTYRVMGTLLDAIKGAAIATTASTEKGEEGPKLPPPADLYIDQKQTTAAPAEPTPAPTATPIPQPTPEAPIYEEVPQGPTAFAKKPVNYSRADINGILKDQPPLIRAIAKVESNFNHRAKSKAGALGLMQLMPANIETFGISDPFDPLQSIEGATQLLAEELNRYKDDPRLAVAAYNAGSPAVDRAIKRAGSRDYAKVRQFLPQETRAYVPKVLAAMRGA